MNSRSVLSFALMVLAMPGCQHTVTTDPSSVRYIPPVGTLLVLREAVVIRRGNAHAFIQNPEAVGGQGEFYAGCTLSVQDVSDRPQVVNPDQFLVTKIQRYQNCYVMTTMNEWQPPGTDVQVATGGDISDCWYNTRMWLHSQGQPQVRTLECQRLGDPAIGRYPTFDEIRLTLSPVGELLRPDGTGFPPARKPGY